MRVNQIRQPIRTENHNYQITERNEFRMAHGERTSIREVELEGPKTVGGQLSQFIDVHPIKIFGEAHLFVNGFLNLYGIAAPFSTHSRIFFPASA